MGRYQKDKRNLSFFTDDHGVQGLVLLNHHHDYQDIPKALLTFVRNKQFGQLINISPHSLTIMNTINTEFSSVEVWFKDQASKALEIEGNVNLMLIIGWTL